MIAGIADDVAGWIGAPTVLIVLALVALRVVLMRWRRKRKRANLGGQRGSSGGDVHEQGSS